MRTLLILATALLLQEAASLQKILDRHMEVIRKASGPEQRDAATRAALADVEKFFETAKEMESASRARKVLGDMCRSLEDYAGAATHFRKFLEAWPKHPNAAIVLMDLGHVLFEGGQDAPAREAFQELIRHHPTDPRVFEARIRIAQTYVTEKNEEESLKALAALREEFKGKPEEWIAAMQQAAVFQIAGRAPEGRAVLEEIVRVSPQRNAAEFAKDVLVKWLWLGKPAPAIEGKDLAGAPFRLADYQGKIVVLYFLTSSVKEFGVETFVLRRLIRSVPATEVAVLGVAIDSDRAKLEANLKQVRVTWPVLHDGNGLEGAAATLYRLKSVPLMVVIDRKGVIRAVNLLFSEHGRELVRYVEKLAAEK
jgi:tetratricopeptide (TPR) repeat protein